MILFINRFCQDKLLRKYLCEYNSLFSPKLRIVTKSIYKQNHEFETLVHLSSENWEKLWENNRNKKMVRFSDFYLTEMFKFFRMKHF